MIEPIKPGDALFPYEVEMVDGRWRITRKREFSGEEQVAFNLRSIEYLLQFAPNHGSVGLINMIDGYARRAMSHGTEKQKDRFRELMSLRQSWLDAQNAA